MANGENFFGQKSGSTKSLTFQIRNGKQIVKDRVYRDRNPRSESQMEQRCRLATCGLAYRYMRDIVNHSFEGCAGAAQNMARFQKLNMKQMKLSQGDFGYANYGEQKFKPGFYVLSEGNLQAVADWTPSIENNKLVLSSAIQGGSLTEAQICNALGLEELGDMVTVCFVVPSELTDYVFGFIRFKLVRMPSANVLAADTPLSCISYFANKGTSFGALQYTAGNANLHIVMTSILNSYLTPGAEYVGTAVIRSRKSDTGWLTSHAQLKMGAGWVASSEEAFAAAVATYPKGESLILHGGDGSASSNPSSGGGEEPTPSPEPSPEPETVAAPTILGTTPFETSSEVTIAAEEGDVIKYTTDGSDPTIHSGNTYSAPFTINDSCTVKAIAIRENVGASSVASKVFTKQSGGGGGETPNKPTITGTANFQTTTTVTITADAGATIRFTRNGDAPTANTGEVYEEPFTLSDSATIKAIAVVGGVASEVTTRIFTKNTGD